ncbi:MAG: hypothetical protein JWO67_60 [Streptosporangiaceae bacterium]|nr:hypothetical protein [Streptosporangiaceae bacterium]
MRHASVTRAAAAVGATIFALSACAAPQPGPHIVWTPPSSGNLRLPRPSSASTRNAFQVVGSAPADLQSIDWKNASLPGQFCGIRHTVTFKSGEVSAQSNTWGSVHLSVSTVTYGSLDAGGQTDAVVQVGCDNGGGTADGQLVFAAIVLARSAGNLEVLGTILPQVNPQGVHVTLMDNVKINAGSITVQELWYRPSDSTCCATGRATTQWTWANDHLTAGTPDVTN